MSFGSNVSCGLYQYISFVAIICEPPYAMILHILYSMCVGGVGSLAGQLRDFEISDCGFTFHLLTDLLIAFALVQSGQAYHNISDCRQISYM